MPRVIMEKEEFLKLMEKAIDMGFRKCYIKKLNATVLFKGNIYFNISGIYKYENGQFKKICALTEENLDTIINKDEKK